ncbi:conjugative transposon protein TraJ [Sphingobacterium sp. PU5-4]|uniref:Conjugative transposon protein TraJ n=1 Tax=Sphingobacterium tenebrionis TaxID=3111775 RepID=A0ABU8I2W1_9SPHI
MKRRHFMVIFFGCLALCPQMVLAQDLGQDLLSLREVLEQLYLEMVPLSQRLMGVGQGLAGFAALLHISIRVWRHLSRAEGVDVYPLLRPFAIGLCIAFFPAFMGLVNGILSPTVAATNAMVEDSQTAIEVLLEKKREAVKQTIPWQIYVGEGGEGDRDLWYRYTYKDEDPTEEGLLQGIGNDIKFAMAKAAYGFRNGVKEWMSEILELLFQAAALCIDTLRTFQLVVLTILGPLVFGLSVFEGFHHTLTVWLARYINIFLWLPVANIFGSIIGRIQQKMLLIDLAQIQVMGDTMFDRTHLAYQIFLIIGIVGYFTVPSVANYIVHSSDGSVFGVRVTQMFSSTADRAVVVSSSGLSMARDSFGDAASSMGQGMAQQASNSPYFNDQQGFRTGKGRNSE